MKNCSKLIFTFLLFSFSVAVFAQKEQVDSLKLLLKKAESDTQKINLLLLMVEAEPEDSIGLIFNSKAEELIHSTNNLKSKNEKFYFKTLGTVNHNKGIVLYREGNYEPAIKFQHKAHDFFKQAENESGIAEALNSIGIIHLNLGQFQEAIEFFNSAYNINIELKDTSNISTTLANMAVTYSFLKQPDKQIKKLREALVLSRLSNNRHAESSILNNMAVYYFNTQKIDSAKKLMRESLEISKQSKVDNELAFSYLGMAGFYRMLEKYDTAMYYGKKALALGEELNSIDLVKRAAVELYDINEQNGNYKEALKYYVLYRDKKDSLLKEESQTAALRKQFSFEKEKQAAITKAEKERQQLITGMISIGLLLVLIFAGLMFNRFKVTQKQKKIIEVQQVETKQQKEIVEEKNKEITDSINYAKRLQQAILPPDKLIKQYLPKSFVFFKPKDVVSGDFYWMEKKGNKIMLAAADCTGHGVPGAMVSVVCNNALNRSVNEYGFYEPAKILDKTRELVIETFEKSDEEVKDGMDIALCSINFLPGEGELKRVELQYAGANNPLWIYRKGIDDLLHLEEIKADKQPIGKHATEKPFTNHTIKLQKGDTVYFFTDGFADQFGGDKGKKFKYKPFKELLLSVQNNTMEEQQQILAKEFENWRGDLEQIDDVCIIGVRV